VHTLGDTRDDFATQSSTVEWRKIEQYKPLKKPAKSPVLASSYFDALRAA
jgi:hypothetical protein